MEWCHGSDSPFCYCTRNHPVAAKGNVVEKLPQSYHAPQSSADTQKWALVSTEEVWKPKGWQQSPQPTSSFASILHCPGSCNGLVLRRDVKQDNIATDLVDFCREITPCPRAGVTQVELGGRFDKWAVETGTVCGAEAGVDVVCVRWKMRTKLGQGKHCTLSHSLSTVQTPQNQFVHLFQQIRGICSSHC